LDGQYNRFHDCHQREWSRMSNLQLVVCFPTVVRIKPRG
jgi:hypothetical protein